jgi:hypothetical protein
MGIRFWRKADSVIRVSPREAELIADAEAEAANNRVQEIDSDDNMPATALKPLISKRNGKGFKNLTFQGNLYETKFVDEINERFAQAELIEKQKRPRQESNLRPRD